MDVHIVTPYKIMVPLIHAAFEVLLQTHNASTNQITSANFHCDTIDSSQGSTFSIAVLAIAEDLSEWSTFLTDPFRIVTMISRSFRTMAIPRLTGETQRRRMSFEIQKLLKQFAIGDVQYEWWKMQRLLGETVNAWELWSEWLHAAGSFVAAHHRQTVQKQP